MTMVICWTNATKVVKSGHGHVMTCLTTDKTCNHNSGLKYSHRSWTTVWGHFFLRLGEDVRVGMEILCLSKACCSHFHLLIPQRSKRLKNSVHLLLVTSSSPPASIRKVGRLQPDFKTKMSSEGGLSLPAPRGKLTVVVVSACISYAN